MGQEITYANKDNFKLEPSIPANKKVTKDDMNEIKSVVNANEALMLEEVEHDATLGGKGTLLDPLTVLGITPTGYEDLITGVIFGGEITINADPTKFDIAAGQGIVMDWTDPQNPVRTIVSWTEQLAQLIPDINQNITTVSIDAAGTIIIVSGPLLTPAAQRIRIQLQIVIHTSHTQIDRVTNGNRPAYQVTTSLLDYIQKLGPINTGNFVDANATNLVVKREAGTTTLPFINRLSDPQDPTNKVNPAEAPVVEFIQSYRDGLGDFTSVPVGVVSPDTYDTGTGLLAIVPVNKWTVKRFYFFGQTNVLYLTEGQAIYDSQAEAEASILTENPILTPITDLGTFVTALVVKKGAIDLSDTATAKFIDVNISGSSSSVGTTVVSWGNILGTITDQADLIAEFDKLGLEQLDEGNGIGFRLKGKDAANYGPIGLHAIDLSESPTPSATKGATGTGAKAEGLDVTASGTGSHAEGQLTEAIGDSSHAEGGGTIAQNPGSHAEGTWNEGTSPDTISETGIGTGSGDRKNGFEVYKDGTLKAPNSTPTLIDSRGAKALITKEYFETKQRLQLAGAYGDETTDLATGQVWSKRIAEAFSLTNHKFDVVTAPTGQAITVDTKKNGVSIWTVKPTIGIGAFVSTDGTLVTNPTVFAVGDLMTEHIDAVGTTIKGAGLKGDPIATLN